MQSRLPHVGGKRGLLGQGSSEGGPQYWDAVCLLLRQFDGMVEGYQVGKGGMWGQELTF